MSLRPLYPFCILLSLAFLFAFMLSSPALGESEHKQFSHLKQQYRILKRGSSQTFVLESWLSLIQQFESFKKNYPNHPQAPNALFHIAHLYRNLFHHSQKSAHLNQSLHAFRSLIQTYPQSTLADDSQFNIASIYEKEKQDPSISLLEYMKVLDTFDGDQKSRAQQKIRELQKQTGAPIHPFSSAQSHIVSHKAQQQGIPLDVSRALPTAKIESIQTWATEQWAKIAIGTSRAIPYIFYQTRISPSETSRSHVFHVDLLDSRPAPTLPISKNQFIIQDVQLTFPNKRTTRVVISLHPGYTLTAFDYETSHGVTSGNLITLEATPVDPFPSKKREDQQENAKYDSEEKVVIIDPGHGGKDPGASGFGLHEKDVVLSVALALKKKLANQEGVSVVLTRETDRFLSIQERSAIVKQHKGDLFISLHANAHSLASVHGLEAYYLDTTVNPDSIQLAKQENQMSSHGMANFEHRILKELATRTQQAKSAQLTQMIYHQLFLNVQERYTQTIRDLGVKKGPFLILYSAGVPATLLELSFITNFEENQRLRDPNFSKIAADGIAKGLQTYLKQHKRKE